MPGATELWEKVRAAQLLLGTGEAAEALEKAQALRVDAVQLLGKGALMTSFDRSYANAAYAYATVTTILAMAETKMPAEFVPKVRDLTAEAARRHRPGTHIWKAVTAGAEVLARAGDSEGAVWAIKRAMQLEPKNDDLIKVKAGISSMYPSVFKQMPDDVGPDPPEPKAP